MADWIIGRKYHGTARQAKGDHAVVLWGAMTCHAAETCMLNRAHGKIAGDNGCGGQMGGGIDRYCILVTRERKVPATCYV
jgi:hypothetical protein